MLSFVWSSFFSIENFFYTKSWFIFITSICRNCDSSTILCKWSRIKYLLYWFESIFDGVKNWNVHFFCQQVHLNCNWNLECSINIFASGAFLWLPSNVALFTSFFFQDKTILMVFWAQFFMPHSFVYRWILFCIPIQKGLLIGPLLRFFWDFLKRFPFGTHSQSKWYNGK